MANNLDKLTILRSLQIEIPFVVTCLMLYEKKMNHTHGLDKGSHIYSMRIFSYILFLHTTAALLHITFGESDGGIFSQKIK